jgi:hypothetical protein
MRLEQLAEGIPSQLGRRVLDFDEVMTSGRPAVFLEYGDFLFYLGGMVFILKDVHQRAAADAEPPFLDASSLVVGVETGWRHEESCGCEFCSGETGVRAA